MQNGASKGKENLKLRFSLSFTSHFLGRSIGDQNQYMKKFVEKIPSQRRRRQSFASFMNFSGGFTLLCAISSQYNNFHKEKKDKGVADVIKLSISNRFLYTALHKERCSHTHTHVLFDVCAV